MTVKVGYSISDISAIKALPTALLLNGYARLCRSVNAWFSYNSTSTATADDVSILLPASGIGRWFKLKADVAATDVLNFNESVDDRVASLIQNSSTISASYNDAANTLTFSVVGGSIGDAQVSSLSQSKITNLTSDLAGKLSANQNIVISGDATGSGATSITLTLANSGVTAGSYTNPTLNIDSKGRITSATNGTSLSNPMTATGDLIVGGNSGVATRFPPNNTTEKKYLSQYVQVGSSTLWTPTNIATQLWLDAADSTTITTVSGGVSQWNDKSGNNRNAIESNAAKRPVLLPSNINGLDVLAFDNSDDGMTTGWNLSATSNYMIFIVVNQTSSGDKRVINSTTYNNQISNSRAGGQYVQIKNDVVVSTGWATSGTTNQSVLVAPPSGNFSYFGNGTGIATNAKSVTDWGVLTFGALGVYNEPMNGKLCEVIVIYDSDAVIRQLTEGYLAHKWGLTANLPSNHPYKTNAPTTSGTASQIVTQWDTVPLEDSGVVAGTYTNANITVDAKGRVTSAVNGTESIQDEIANTLVAGTNISLNYNDTAGTLTINSTAGSSGTNVEIRDEGITLTSAATSLNFVGAGVSATNTGGDVTVTIEGNRAGLYEFFNLI